MSILAKAVVGIVGGAGLAVLLTVPWVAWRFRRRGSVGVGDLLIAGAVSIYTVALLAYTLLPLPVSEAEACETGPVTPQLRLGYFVGDVSGQGGLDGPASLLSNPAALPVMLNVALFVPLGAFVRHLSQRGRYTGIALGAGAGLLTSLVIELTQLTGVWGLFACSYRQFNVDDLLANTVGALLGALVAPVLRRVPGQQPVAPDRVRPVTAGRRLLGMVCDALAVLLFVAVSAAAVTLLLVRPEGPVDLSPTAHLLFGLLPAAGQLALVLGTGRTLGELVVRLRPVPRPGPIRAFLRWAAGIGGWTVLGALNLNTAQLLFTGVAVLGVFLTRDRRGLAASVAGMQVADDRDARPVTPPQAGTAGGNHELPLH